MDPYRWRELSIDAATSYVRAAGMGGNVVRATPCKGGVANFNHELLLDNGRRVLLRTYAARGGAASHGRATETFLQPLLVDYGVRAPAVLASPPDPADFAVFEWIAGVRLRDAAATELDASRLDAAWEATGRALRRTHELRIADFDGTFEGSTIQPVDPPWWEQDRATMRDSAATLLSMGLIQPVDFERILRIADRAQALIGHHVPSVLHGDAHAANVLVQEGASSWVLAAWIDWERACIGDVESELATFDVFTRAQVGRTPESFWRGYGRRPDPAKYPFYELETLLALAPLDHAQSLPPGREARRLVTTELGRLLDVLDA
ncbi:MAG: phosphotransferase [Chloroflexota bacterium]|nr:phosphotransferase [Chloroflexota bacterium]